MMKLQKGSIIRETRRNDGPEFKNTTANGTLIYKVVRVNPKTYGLECIEGYMKGTRCNLCKDAPETCTDMWGTVTTREIVA